MMRAAISFAAAALLAGSLARAEEPRPVLVSVQGNLGAQADGISLLMLGISAWANHYVNKHSVVKVELFRKTLGEVDFDGETARAFGCVGAGPDCSVPGALADPGEFQSALRRRDDKSGVIVEILPEMIPEQMLLRAAVHYVTLEEPKPDSQKKVTRLVQHGGYTALVSMRAPADLAAQRKTNPAALEQFWTAGEPRHAVGEMRRGLVKLNELFALLTRDVRPDAKVPESWKELPKIKEFKDGDRVACHGPAFCTQIHLFKDEGDGFILVGGTNTAGWFDATAAAKETNILLFAMLGIPWD